MRQFEKKFLKNLRKLLETLRKIIVKFKKMFRKIEKILLNFKILWKYQTFRINKKCSCVLRKNCKIWKYLKIFRKFYWQFWNYFKKNWKFYKILIKFFKKLTKNFRCYRGLLLAERVDKSQAQTVILYSLMYICSIQNTFTSYNNTYSVIPLLLGYYPAASTQFTADA